MKPFKSYKTIKDLSNLINSYIINSLKSKFQILNSKSL